MKIGLPNSLVNIMFVAYRVGLLGTRPIVKEALKISAANSRTKRNMFTFNYFGQLLRKIYELIFNYNYIQLSFL